MGLEIDPIPSSVLPELLGEIARLRIEVFRSWPYLYDGDADYERRYLETYVKSPTAIVVGAWDGDRLVGASTGTPLEDHANEFGAPFEAAGIDMREVFYCAESVLLPGYRGQGAGQAFFDRREAHARALGRAMSCFCAVVRPPDHAARPPGYAPLDPFWRKRGYTPMEGGLAQFAWRDLGDAEETAKPMQFWLRTL